MNKLMKFRFYYIFIILLTVYSSCSVKPEPIKYGKDNCNYCKMTITDNRFASELLTNKGKIYKFDEISCMLAFASEQELDSTKINGMYITDYCPNNNLINKNSMIFMLSDSLKSPMGGNVAAFSSKDSLKKYSDKISGKTLTWDEVIKYSIEE